jgi:hypothetical protein
MPNRILTRDEVYDEIDAIFLSMGLKPPPRAVADALLMGPIIEPSVRESPQPSQYPTSDAYNRALTQHQAQAACHHCWHVPRDWQQGTLQLPVPRLCCWCGVSDGPQHGPYAPKV